MHVSAPSATATAAVRRLIAELSELPANANVALRVLHLLDRPDADASRLGQLVETDPALAAHTMRLANAAALGMSNRVASARQAVLVLGFELVRSLAVLTAGELLPGGRREAPDGWWQHSLSVAAGSMVVARRTGRGEGEACSVGLLHDLGAALQFRAAPERYEAMVAATPDDPAARFSAEQRSFGLDHAEAGAAVLAAWNFPDAVVEALRAHHRLPVPGTGELVLVVRAGEAIADLVHPGDPGEAIAEPVEAATLAGIQDPDVDALAEEVDEQFRSLLTFLV